MDIVEKAKTFNARNTPKYATQEEAELTKAILKKEITLGQAAHALGYKNGGMQIYVMFVRACRLLVAEGKLKIEE